MMRRFTPIAMLLALSTLAAAPIPANTSGPLKVHEWGTFTSVAGHDGRAVEWLPLSGPPDLPCFVDRFSFNIKGSLRGKVRMETPVLYFYAPHETTVDVKVGFRQGVVTEWFPRAFVTPASADDTTLRRPDFASSISWADVKVTPFATPNFRTDGSGSHYYLARQTDASPLQVGSEKERFLFYRGLGQFGPPISAAPRADGTMVVRIRAGSARRHCRVRESRWDDGL